MTLVLCKFYPESKTNICCQLKNNSQMAFTIAFLKLGPSPDAGLFMSEPTLNLELIST